MDVWPLLAQLLFKPHVQAQPLDFSMLFSSTSALLGISAAMILGG